MENDAYKKFYDSVGSHYPEEDAVYNSLKGKLRRKFVSEKLSDWKGPLLDIGCNRGIYLRMYQGGFRMGVDLSFSVLSFLREQDANMGLAVADAQNLDCIRDNSFSIVLCSEVLEHVYNTEKHHFLADYLPEGISIEECVEENLKHAPFSTRDRASRYLWMKFRSLLHQAEVHRQINFERRSKTQPGIMRSQFAPNKV